MTSLALASSERPVGQVPLGIVGGGQLARMTVLAASRLGIEVWVLALPTDDSILSICPNVVYGDPNDPQVLDEFTRRCRVVTFDHENVEADTVEALTKLGRTIRPGAAALRFCNKALQRSEFAALGFPVPMFAIAENADEVARFADRCGGWPIIAKSQRGGYDGRGVHRVENKAQAVVLCAAVGGALLVEPALAIQHELSVLLARRPGGAHVVYPVVEAFTRDFVCDSLVAPATIEPALADEACAIAIAIADLLDTAGILAVEYFVVDDQIVINEIAPRPHNTGHFTIEGCVTSQFENHLRGVLDLPLGSTAIIGSAVATANVFGATDGRDPRARIASALAIDDAHVHLYGKSPRPGRKLGHVTALATDTQSAHATACRSRDALVGDPA